MYFVVLLVQTGCSDWLVGVAGSNGGLERFQQRFLKKAGKLWLVISLRKQNYPRWPPSASVTAQALPVSVVTVGLHWSEAEQLIAQPRGQKKSQPGTPGWLWLC